MASSQVERHSYAIALVLLPPPNLAAVVDTLRSANDKSWPRWSAHVTVLFPFGTITDLPSIVDTLQSALATYEPFLIHLDTVGRFSTRNYETVYLGTSNPGPVQALWRTVVTAMSYQTKHEGFTPHMTLGQTARNPEAIAFLTAKGTRLLELYDFTWVVDSVALLRKQEDDGGKMLVHSQIPLGPATIISPRSHVVLDHPTYYFNGQSWTDRKPTPRIAPISSLTVATYNILHDPSFPFSTRLPHVIDSVLESNADVICLQEVTDHSLYLLLQDERIRRRWPWCTRRDQSVMESERNIVLLASEECSFTWMRVELGGKHKACVVARLALNHSMSGKSTILAAVHLSAGRSQAILEMKRAEMARLLAYLQENHAQDDWIIFGDVNCPSGEALISDDDILDVWEESIAAGGATYDPTVNAIAALTARACRTPERYDRVFIRKGRSTKIVPGASSLFGFPKTGGQVASDHWGLSVTLRLGDIPTDSQSRELEPVSQPAVASTTPLPLTVAFSDSQLAELCLQNGFLPSDSQNRAFQNALDALRDLVASLTPATASPSTSSSGDLSMAPPPATGVRLVVAPVGSFAMGYHTVHSDIDCVIVGNITPKTLWSLLHLNIRNAPVPQRVKLRRFVKDALVQMMELDIDGVKVDVQYCPAPKLVDCWEDLSKIPRDSPLFSMPVSALRTLNAHRDSLALLNALPSLDAFRLAHRSLKLFMHQRGIVGARFGFLGGFHTAFLLARICLDAPPTASAALLVQLFFSTYAQWDWENQIVTVPLPGSAETSDIGYRRSKREPLVVLSVEKPQVNMTVNANPNSVAVMRNVFQEANRSLDSGLSWKAICGGCELSTPVQRFINVRTSFVRIDVSYWGGSCMKGRAWVGWLESRFVGLLVQLHESAPGILCHLWPARLADTSNTDAQSLNGFYLIGLSSMGSESDRETAKQSKSEIKNGILTTLRTFEHDIKSNARFYNQTDMFISVTHTTAAKLPSSIGLDAYQWPDGGYDDADDDEEINEEEDRQDDQDGADTPHTGQKKRHGTPTTSHVPATKLRTSSDIYNRLMWDPAIAKEDYVIGYEDRFKGTKEVSLLAWKREVEDEAFIPFHRVVHFRRKSDNVKVWDRKTKVDLLFGSGVKSP